MNKQFIILAPCYNESQVIKTFLDELELKLSSSDYSYFVLIVDDASTDSTLEILTKYKFNNVKFELKVIRLINNSGHQEAIRQGLNYAKKLDSDIRGLIVLDSDGEDDPSAINELIQLKDLDIAFVERGKRKEDISFKVGYFFYQLIFKLITGKKISFGNYSMISPMVLNAIADQHFFHYAGFLSKQKFKIKKIKYNRQKRLDGSSKMSYKNLVFHGLYSLIEYSEEILFTLIKAFLIIFSILFIYGNFVLYSKFISHMAISGWASSIISNLILSGLIIISTLIISLLLLSLKKIIIQKSIHYNEIN